MKGEPDPGNKEATIKGMSIVLHIKPTPKSQHKQDDGPNKETLPILTHAVTLPPCTL